MQNVDMNLSKFLVFTSACALGACGGGGSPQNTSDASTSDSAATDSAASDSGASDSAVSDSGASDSGPTTSDVGGESAVDAGPLVAACEAAAKNFATLCVGDSARVCLWNAYAALCATGQTQLLIDSMKCLDNTICRTFSDPNEGAACLATLHTKSETAAAKALVQSQCAACGGTSCSTITGTAEIFPYLTDADLAALSTCAGTACVTTTTTCKTSPGISLFASCF
jgi:hypothetical protein